MAENDGRESMPNSSEGKPEVPTGEKGKQSPQPVSAERQAAELDWEKYYEPRKKVFVENPLSTSETTSLNDVLGRAIAELKINPSSAEAITNYW